MILAKLLAAFDWAQVAVAEAHFSLRPVGVGVQAGAVQGYYVAL